MSSFATDVTVYAASACLYRVCVRCLLLLCGKVTVVTLHEKVLCSFTRQF